MKLFYNRFLFLLPMLLVIGTVTPGLSQQQHVKSKTGSEVSFWFAPKEFQQSTKPATTPSLIDGLNAFGNNILTNDLYSFDVDDPMSFNVIGELTMQTSSGDFHPEEMDYMYMMDISTNYMGKVDVSTGETVDSVLVTVPLVGGIWTVLSIHKTLGVFYGVASNGSISNIYEIDPVSGATTFVFNTGLNLIISGTLDGNGVFWLLEIPNSEIFKFDLATLELELVGPAGFSANFAQGMAYDPEQDEVYLAAYEDGVGPQLRLLNRTSGAATYIADLPGSTTAFGFAGGVAPIEHAIQIPAGWSGISSYINPQDNNLENILDPVSNDFVLLKNTAGDIYWPQQNIFSLQTWAADEGYIINMDQPATLTISGYPIQNQTLNFTSGWNFLAVIIAEETPIDVLFENIEGFVMAKEIAGTGVYWPEHQINTLGNVVPGKAYYIYNSQDISVTF